MKKILITFFALLLTTSISYAGECSIKNAPAPALMDFLNQNRIVIKNITNDISSTQKDDWIIQSIKDEASRYYSVYISAYNNLFNFQWYNSYFTYYVIYPLSNDIPIQVRRDYFLLKKEKEFIDKYVESMINNKRWLVDLTEPCDWIDSKFNCNVWTNSIEGLTKISKNINTIMDLYRLSVIWKASNFTWAKELQFIDSNWISEIISAYTPKWYDWCSAEKWGFFETITKAIKNIWELNEQWEKWIQDWKDALDILFWRKSDKEMLEMEKELLKEELNRQWFSKNQQESMLNSLDEFNQNEISMTNNFITKWFTNLKNEIEDKWNEFNNEVIGDFFSKEENQVDTTISEIWNLNKKSDTFNQVKNRVDMLHKSTLPTSASQQFNTTNLRTRIQSIHAQLQSSNKLLEKMIKKAEQLCESQGHWKWICSFK